MPFVTPAVRHRPPRARPTRLGGTTWSDEFDGSSVNLSKWSFEVGDGSEHGIPGWGNNELQSYNPASASVAEGVLRIVASKDPRSAHVNLAGARRELGGEYRSARLTSHHKFDYRYGRLKVRRAAS